MIHNGMEMSLAHIWACLGKKGALNDFYSASGRLGTMLGIEYKYPKLLGLNGFQMCRDNGIQHEDSGSLDDHKVYHVWSIVPWQR